MFIYNLYINFVYIFTYKIYIILYINFIYIFIYKRERKREGERFMLRNQLIQLWRLPCVKSVGQAGWLEIQVRVDMAVLRRISSSSRNLSLCF